ncbi:MULTISPECIES: glycosyltransferase family A protein [unclassified Priestia]|uniref:glycosyltransferase family A protein n=1 Tax=unclassified Priestia TaxID=2800374 RepID=UPI00366C7C57
MNKKIIVSITFNTFGFTADRLTENWIKNRIELFMNYTAKSLISQTNQDFLTLVLYEDETKQIIDTSLSQYNKLPSNIKFVGKKEYNQTLKASIKDFEYLYLVRIDSDDMYHKTYIEQLHQYKHKPDTEVIINQNGYLFDINTGSLAPIFYESPQFYTLIYKTADYLKGKRYVLPGGHAGAITLNHEIISKRNFLNIIHQKNTLPKIIARKNTILEKEESQNILKMFRN